LNEANPREAAADACILKKIMLAEFKRTSDTAEDYLPAMRGKAETQHLPTWKALPSCWTIMIGTSRKP
jgi:hypothetical protein